MSRPRVFVVQPIAQPVIDALLEVADVEVYPYTDRMVSTDELADVARRGANYLFTMHETIIERAVIEAATDLRGVVAWAWGAGEREFEDFIDVAACAEHGVAVLPLPAAEHEIARTTNAKATADLTVALLMCLAYRVIESDAYTRAGRFRQEMTMDLMGVGCTNKIAGIIGMGVVARELVPRLKALDMDVRYTKRTRLSPDEEAQLGIQWVDTVDQLVTDADYVCMLANYHPDALGLMGEQQFKLMKDTAYFINTGRGRLVDEPAMIRALQDGTIAGAGLDVYWDEPPVVHDPDVPIALRRLHNVVLAPHNGGSTMGSRVPEMMSVAQAILDHIAAS